MNKISLKDFLTPEWTSRNIKNTLNFLTWYKETQGCSGVVLGLSGGKDSTVVAMLAQAVWGENVFALLMPNDTQKDLGDAVNIANKLGLKHEICNIGKAYDALVEALEWTEGMDSDGMPLPFRTEITISDKAKTNIPPRLRMTMLYAAAQSLGYRVIGTGNRSEGMIGWCTKFGDMACDLNPLAHLTCSEVIEMGKVLAEERGLDLKYIVKSPSDGLTRKTDEDNFGFTYAELDEKILCEEKFEGEMKKMHEGAFHKKRLPFTIDDMWGCEG